MKGGKMNKQTKAYKNKKVYNKNYIIKNCKQINLMLNKNIDSDIINFLSQVENKSAYLKNLIRNDMTK